MKLQEEDLKRLKDIEITQLSIDKLLKEYPSVYHLVVSTSVWARVIHKILIRNKSDDETDQESSIYIKPTKIAIELLGRNVDKKNNN
ncbi:MAG: hypothetical protein ACUVWP_08170 [bacterium]